MPITNMNYLCDPGEPVDIVFYDSLKVTGYTDSAPQEKAELALPLAAPKFYRLQSGLLSARDNTLSLRARRETCVTVLTAQDGMGTVGILVRTNGQTQEHKLENVRQIEVHARKVMVIYEARTASAPPPPPTPEPSGEVAALRKQNTKLKEQVKQATQIMNGLKTSTRELLEENKQLKSQNSTLHTAVSQGVDDLIASVRSSQVTVSPDLRAKLDELESLRSQQIQSESQAADTERQIREQEARNAEVEAELQRLNQQLDDLRSQEEVVSLDCDRASDALEALRVRMRMDGDIVTLTESRWLKNNSVTDTIEEVEQKLSALENRIGFILNARELYGTAVQSAVLLSGDGTISADDENGNSNQESQENTVPQN